MKNLLFVLVVSMVAASASASYTKNRTIERVWLSGNDVLLAVSSTPSKVCSHYGAHFRFNHTSDRGKGFLSLLLTSRAMGANIDVWYTDSPTPSTNQSNGCSKSNMATLNGIAITK